MTAEQHNKYVGLAQLGYAVFHLLTTIVWMGIEVSLFRNIYSPSQAIGGTGPPRLLAVMFGLAGVVSLAMIVSSIVAGYALLRRRPWAKIAGIIGGVAAVSSFPIGTGVAVYTFWFLFTDVGKQLYGGKNRPLPPLAPKQRQPNINDSTQDWPSYTPPQKWR